MDRRSFLKSSAMLAGTAVCGARYAKAQYGRAKGPLRANPANPRYFVDDSGKAVFLTGSHTWANLQDSGLAPVPIFDWQAYLNMMQAHDHNFMRLWGWQQSAWAPWTPDKVLWETPWMVIYPLASGFSYDPDTSHYKGALWIVHNIVDTATRTMNTNAVFHVPKCFVGGIGSPSILRNWFILNLGPHLLIVRIGERQAVLRGTTRPNLGGCGKWIHKPGKKGHPGTNHEASSLQAASSTKDVHSRAFPESFPDGDVSGSACIN